MNEINISHKIKQIDGEDVVYLFVELNLENEFAKEFFKFNKENKDDSFISNISKYAKKKLSDKVGNVALIIVNGVVIGSIAITALIMPIDENSDNLKLTPDIKVEENIEKIKEGVNVVKETINKISTKENKDINNLANEEKKKQEEDKKAEKNEVDISKETAVASNNKVTKPSNNSNSASNQSSSNSSNSNVNNNQSTGIKVKVKLSNGQVLSLGLEEYVVRSCFIRNASII